MSRLSNEIITNIANKLVEKSYKHWQQLRKEFSEAVTALYEKQVPADVMKAFKSNCEYLRTCNSVDLNGHGFSRQTVGLSKSLPSIRTYNVDLDLTAGIADKLIKQFRKVEKAKDEYEILLSETKSALYALKTIKNVRENLPQAIPFLPPPISRSLVVNFDSLQKKLNKQPEPAKVTA